MQQEPRKTQYVPTVVGAIIIFFEFTIAIVVLNTMLRQMEEDLMPPAYTIRSIAETAETAGWETYRNEILGLTFKYPPGTQVNFYPDAMLAGVIRVVSEADPNKDSNLYSVGIGPGPIGIVSYVYQSDLKSFAEGFANGKIPAQPASVAGVSGFRITGVLEASDNRVLGSRIADIDYYFITYNAATWGFEYDDNAEIESSPTHEDFMNILSTFQFTD